MEFPSQIRNRETPRWQIRLPSNRPVTAPRYESSTQASRRLSFQTPSFYSHPQTSSLRPDSEVYVPDTPERETYWSPGQILPTTTLTQPLEYGQSDLRTMIQNMHSSIESNFRDVKNHLTELEGRVTSIEEKQLELQHSSPTSNSSSSESCETGRKRRSPSELQHEIRSVHTALDEENRLLPDERIDSEHNKVVVDRIVQEVGTAKYTRRQIQDGVKTYRKSLKEAAKGRSSGVQARVRIRSRQQRLFERRAKVVKKQTVELKLWRHVTADMMSEEEEDDDGFVRHRFSWRSQVLNKFIEKLDKRYTTKNGKSLAKKRVYGA